MKSILDNSQDIDSKIYLLAAINAMINDVYLTDLGSYELECELALVNRYYRIASIKDAAMVIMVKLRNINTGEVEYHNTFYKIIRRFSTFKEDSKNDKAYKDWHSQVYEADSKGRLAFILRTETKMVKKMYATSYYDEKVPFLNEFIAFDDYGREYFKPKRIVTNEAAANIDDALLNVMTDLKERLSQER